MSEQTTSTTKSLVAFASRLDHSDVPDEVRHQACRVILDTLTCAVMGSSAEGPRIVTETLLEFGGNPEATVVCEKRKTSAPVAAFVNAAAANACDMDDNLLYHSHIANTVVTAGLAIAEREGLAGKDLVTAVAVGYEVAARLSLAMSGPVRIINDGGHERIGWPDPVGHSYNTVGAAACTAHLLGCSEQEYRHAIGLAVYSAPVPSLKKSTLTGRLPLSKVSAYGWQAWAACVAGVLAKQGYTGDDTALDGPSGFFRMVTAEEFSEESVLDGLGESWWILQTSFKLEPAGTWMRPALRALASIKRSPHFSPEQIAKIEIGTLPISESELWRQANPQTYLDAQVSWPYLVAVSALDIPPAMWQHEQTYRNEDVRGLLNRIALTTNPDAISVAMEDLRRPPYRMMGVQTNVRVTLKNGTVLEEEARYGDGDPFSAETHVTDEDLARKFDTFAAPLLVDADAILQGCWRLEEDHSVRELMNRLRG